MRYLILLLILQTILVSCEQPTEFYRDNLNDANSANFEPDKVTGLKAIIATENSIRVNWESRNSESVRFQIERRVDNSEFEVVDILSYEPVIQFTENLPLVENSEYQYRITSVKGDYKSEYAYSDPFIFEVKSPEDITIKGTSSTEAILRWKSGNEYATTYTIEYREQDNSDFQLLAENVEDTLFNASGLNPAHIYDFRISAATSNYQSPGILLSASYRRDFEHVNTLIDYTANWPIGVVYLDNEHIAVAHRDGTVRIFDSETGQFLKTIVAHSGKIGSIKILEGGAYFVTSGGDNLIKVWDRDANLKKTYKATAYNPEEFPTEVGSSSDGYLIGYQGSNPHSYTIRNIKTDEKVGELSNLKSPQDISFTPDGSYIVYISTDTLRVVETPTMKLIDEYHLPDKYLGIHTAEFSRDGKMIYGASVLDAIMISMKFSPETGLSDVNITEGAYEATDFAFTSDFKYVVVGAAYYDQDMLIVDITSDTIVSGHPITGYTYSVSLHPARQRIVRATLDRVDQWDISKNWFEDGE